MDDTGRRAKLVVRLALPSTYPEGNGTHAPARARTDACRGARAAAEQTSDLGEGQPPGRDAPDPEADKSLSEASPSDP
jgi:hypothetical protein